MQGKKSKYGMAGGKKTKYGMAGGKKTKYMMAGGKKTPKVETVSYTHLTLPTNREV